MKEGAKQHDQESQRPFKNPQIRFASEETKPGQTEEQENCKYDS